MRGLFLFLVAIKYDTNTLLFSAFVGVGTREGRQEETGEYGRLSDARGGEIKRGNVTINIT